MLNLYIFRSGAKWPDHRPWKMTLRTKTYAKLPAPITRAELARRLAKLLVKFTQVKFDLPHALWSTVAQDVYTRAYLP